MAALGEQRRVEFLSMKIHPVSDLFPMLTQAELRDLAESITREGQMNPCVKLGDVLLDGRNRIAACELAGVPLVAVMSGQSYLPEVLRRLCEHLKYRWVLAYMLPGGQAVQQWQAKVNTTWKPVLLFGEASEWFGDVAVSETNDNDKRFHEWGQSESGMADLVERLTKPGQLVCDPFLGAGTTAVVSLALGRRFVGCDIDAACVEQAWARVLAT